MSARPSSRAITQSASGEVRATRNWEQLAVKLLQRDYEMLQAEIQEHQQRYIENRSAFMDEVRLFSLLSFLKKKKKNLKNII